MKIFILLFLILFCFDFIICIENKYIKIPIKYDIKENMKNKIIEKRDGNVNLNNFENVYYGEIKINNQSFKMVFDTGSIDVWIPGNICGICSKSNLYKIDNIDEKNYNWWYTRYGSDSFVSGLLINDNIGINGLLLKNQTLGIAGFISNDLKNVSFDGIMGLGLSNDNYDSIIKNLYIQNVINKKLFGFYIDNKGGEIIFGNYDSSKYIGNLYNITINKNSTFWKTNIDEIVINDKVVNKKKDAIIDTGTTLIIFDEKTANNIANNINAKEKKEGIFIIDCDEQINNLTLTLNINNKNFTISNNNLYF